MSVQKRNSLKNSLRYQDVFCEKLVAFFDVPAYHVSEFTKKDGTVAFVESASDLPTFAAFAKMLGTTSQTLKKWEQEHPAFAHAAQVAR